MVYPSLPPPDETAKRIWQQQQPGRVAVGVNVEGSTPARPARAQEGQRQSLLRGVRAVDVASPGGGTGRW